MPCIVGDTPLKYTVVVPKRIRLLIEKSKFQYQNRRLPSISKKKTSQKYIYCMI